MSDTRKRVSACGFNNVPALSKPGPAIGITCRIICCLFFFFHLLLKLLKKTNFLTCFVCVSKVFPVASQLAMVFVKQQSKRPPKRLPFLMNCSNIFHQWAVYHFSLKANEAYFQIQNICLTLNCHQTLSLAVLTVKYKDSN